MKPLAQAQVPPVHVPSSWQSSAVEHDAEAGREVDAAAMASTDGRATAATKERSIVRVCCAAACGRTCGGDEGSYQYE